MIFWQIFYTFLVIGAFTFGGGYSMVALIQNEVVDHHAWMTAAEFTDLLAVSQMTPGPVGINTATYAGYTAVISAGYPQWAAVCGSLLASFSVIIVPVTLMALVGGWLLRHKDETHVATVMRILRLAVIGLIAAAALELAPAVFQGGDLLQTVVSVIIFAGVFFFSWRYKTSPILLILVSGAVGAVVYSII